jgi:hypothetical protein
VSEGVNRRRVEKAQGRKMPGIAREQPDFSTNVARGTANAPKGENPRSNHTVSAAWGYIGSGSTRSGPRQVASNQGSNVLRPVSALEARTEFAG